MIAQGPREPKNLKIVPCCSSVCPQEKNGGRKHGDAEEVEERRRQNEESF